MFTSVSVSLNRLENIRFPEHAQYMIILFLVFLVQFSLACACLAVNEEQREQLAKSGWDFSSNETRIIVQATSQCCGFKDQDWGQHPSCKSVSVGFTGTFYFGRYCHCKCGKFHTLYWCNFNIKEEASWYNKEPRTKFPWILYIKIMIMYAWNNCFCIWLCWYTSCRVTLQFTRVIPELYNDHIIISLREQCVL